MLAGEGFAAPPPQGGVVYGDIGGRRCRLMLPIGQIGELERLLGAGVWEINERFSAARLHSRDICEIIRLGLIGGGECPHAVASAVVETYVLPRLFEHVRLALDIFLAACAGITPLGDDASGEAEGRNADPATSGPSTPSGGA